ncbi:50S ribosomal protein L15e [Nanoarchaeota archaeon]
MPGSKERRIKMGMYKYIREIWNNPDMHSEIQKVRIMQWRREPVTVKVDRPTRLDRARSLGYKPKPGVIIVRQRVLRGGRQRPQIRAGRRSKHQRRRKIVHKSYKQICEEKASKAYPNCTVINSYYVGQDGKNYWYEVILADPYNPNVAKDKNLSQKVSRRGREFRGLTSAGRKSRGLRKT